MKIEIKKFLVICLLSIFTLLIPSLFGDDLTLSVLLLFIVSLAMLSVDWNIKNIIYYIAIFVSGPLAESIGIHFGAWTYSHPVFIGIPLWLPFVWGNAGLYVLRLKSLIDVSFRSSRMSK
jgi:hypothetical protein